MQQVELSPTPTAIVQDSFNLGIDLPDEVQTTTNQLLCGERVNKSLAETGRIRTVTVAPDGKAFLGTHSGEETNGIYIYDHKTNTLEVCGVGVIGKVNKILPIYENGEFQHAWVAMDGLGLGKLMPNNEVEIQWPGHEGNTYYEVNQINDEIYVGAIDGLYKLNKVTNDWELVIGNPECDGAVHILGHHGNLILIGRFQRGEDPADLAILDTTTGIVACSDFAPNARDMVFNESEDATFIITPDMLASFWERDGIQRSSSNFGLDGGGLGIAVNDQGSMYISGYPEPTLHQIKKGVAHTVKIAGPQDYNEILDVGVISSTPNEDTLILVTDQGGRIAKVRK